jgi:hypothetical protein
MEGKKATLFKKVEWKERKPRCLRKWNGRKESHVVCKEVEWKERKPRSVYESGMEGKKATLCVRKWNGRKESHVVCKEVRSLN